MADSTPIQEVRMQVAAALTALFPQKDPLLVQGSVGADLPSATQPVSLSDLTGLLCRGLTDLGRPAYLSGLPQNTNNRAMVLRERLRYGVPTLLFSFTAEIVALPEPPEFLNDTPPEALALTEPDVARVALLTEWNREEEAQAEGFSHWLSIRRGAALRSGSLRRQTLLRWIGFADAFPNRLLTGAEVDAPQRERAAEFLVRCAGTRRGYLPLRMRRAAEAVEAGALSEAMNLLREGVLRELCLPTPIQSALLRDPSEPLSAIERQELIYLARAGTPEMKTLAGRRLQAERGRREVLRTLQQLCYDAHAWVRASAQRV